MIAAAVDTSGSHASAVVADAAEVRVRLTDVPVGRESAGLLPRLLEALDDAGIPLGDIRRWTIGMGPGSFTGIRVGAALVKGVCLGTGAAYRGLPSSLALALAAEPAPGDTVGVLHDARQGELILTVYLATRAGVEAVGAPRVVLPADLPESDCDHFVACRTLRPWPALPAAVTARLAWLPGVDAAHLLDPAGWPWPATAVEAEASTEPVYVRPAVFVPPREPPGRTIQRLLERAEHHAQGARP